MSTSVYSYEDYKVKPFLATKTIGKLLHDGSLMLLMGAGISKGFGFPGWAELIAKILGKEDKIDDFKKLHSEKLMNLVDDVDDGSITYLKKVHSALYSNNIKISNQISSSPLLLAVAAIVTGSCRGRVNSVFTFNYDDLLEQYLKMLGYSVCIRKYSIDISTRADVELNHVHGYLPKLWKNEGGPVLVLSAKTYRERRASIDEGWSSYLAHSFYSKYGLFLGLSGDDDIILEILTRVKNNITKVKNINRNNSTFSSEKYYGYWLLTPDAFLKNEKKIIETGICPISVTIEDYPKYLFAICQEAAK